MIASIVLTLAVLLLYVFAVRAVFFRKSVFYPTHTHPLQYWWDRLTHRRG